ncbi:MAG: polyprenol phosphomannose-dependent alpha 1,6 mannosyltransferase MptB [Acidimicrobiales bacterium]
MPLRLAGFVRVQPAPGHVTAAPAGQRSSFGLRRMALTGFAASSAVVFGALLGGDTFKSHLPGAWLFGTAGGALGSLGPRVRHPAMIAVFLVYGGLVLLTGCWIELLRSLSRHSGTSVRAVILVLAIWALPFVLSPPLFSHDIYSYAAQGEMASHHIDPYTYGTGVIGATSFTRLAGPLWANTPSPYGQLFVSLDALATNVAGHQVLADLVLLRILALVGVALCVVGLSALSRGLGRDPAETVVLGAGSPLVLTTLVAGAHNDALMVGLLVAGLALAMRDRPVPGIVLCALATGVKAPAALGILFIGWNWAGPDASVRARISRTFAAGLIAVVTLQGVSELSGVGWGWVHTVSAPTKISTGVTPVDSLSHLVVAVGHLVGAGIALHSMRDALGIVAFVAACGLSARLLLRSPRTGTVLSLGLSLLLFALFAPVLWPWYLTWGLVTLAPVLTPRLRQGVFVLIVAGTFVGVAPVLAMAKLILQAGLADDLLLLLGITVVALFSALELSPRGAPRARAWRTGFSRWAAPGSLGS